MFFPILASILPLLSAFSAFLRPMTGKRQPDAKSAQAIKRHKKRTTRITRTGLSKNNVTLIVLNHAKTAIGPKKIIT